MEIDDDTRPTCGVVVSLMQLGDGTTRVILDDVRSTQPQRKTSWQFDCHFTQKRFDSKEVTDMNLPEDEYRGLGVALLARLLALNGLV